MPVMLIFGLGYTTSRLAARLQRDGWQVIATSRTGAPDHLPFDDSKAVRAAIAAASHILSSVPPDRDGRDPVLEAHGDALMAAPARWIGYLSSSGVYGDTGGAWVDEGAPTGAGRRRARAAADAAWLSLHRNVRVFRLPGIYGPGRSPLERVAAGEAHRIDLPGQIFSRIHVDDIGDAVIASFAAGPAGAYNIADDRPANHNMVIEEASRLLHLPPPPLLRLDYAGLSPEARAFYSENRRVANGKAKRLLGWTPRHADYRAGLAALAVGAKATPTSNRS